MFKPSFQLITGSLQATPCGGRPPPATEDGDHQPVKLPRDAATWGTSPRGGGQEGGAAAQTDRNYGLFVLMCFNVIPVTWADHFTDKCCEI